MTIPMPAASPSQGAPVQKKSGSIMPAIRPAAITVGAFGALLVLVQLINMVTSYWLNPHFGIISRQLGGLDGVVFAPLLHSSWQHLLSNLIPLLILGFLVMVNGVKQFVAVTLLVWVVSGIGVWLAGPSNTVTVGASSLVFGWLAYLVCRGVFNRNVGQILLGILLLVIWGGIFWTGIVGVALGPGSSNISWQGHLFGAIGGVLAAFLVSRADGPRRRAKPAAPAALPPPA